MAELRKARFAAAALAALACACAPQLPQPVAPQARAPVDFPAQVYLQAAAQGRPVFRIDPARSLVVIEVRRAGALARFGHDHVVASRDLAGYVAPDEGRADLYVPLDRLTLDEPALRAEAQLDTHPSEADIAGTRQAMLEKVLQTGQFPFVSIRVSGVETGGAAASLNAAVSVHGVTRALRIPAQIEAGADEIAVSGRLALDQTDFGISPYSILGGAIQVRNRVDVRFLIRARRAR